MCGHKDARQFIIDSYYKLLRHSWKATCQSSRLSYQAEYNVEYCNNYLKFAHDDMKMYNVTYLDHSMGK